MLSGDNDTNFFLKRDNIINDIVTGGKGEGLSTLKGYLDTRRRIFKREMSRYASMGHDIDDYIDALAIFDKTIDLANLLAKLPSMTDHNGDNHQMGKPYDYRQG